MLATGKAFNVFFGWEYASGLWIGGLVTVAYTAFGGFKAVAYTDAVQAMLMLFALVAVPLVGLEALGGLSALWSGLKTADSALLSLWFDGGSSAVSLIADRGAALSGIAAKIGTRFKYSAAVGGSAPMVEAVQRAAAFGRIIRLRGVLNVLT